ncbi:Phosphoglycerate dehydrogenase ser3 [Dinochytrium kinnereticum]|nr:Phosphoglycerate dehydrogenase ser3 [Dinochytrium kinnereticum]
MLMHASLPQVECFAKALPEDQLKEKIKDVHAIGLRSKTQLTKEVLQEAKELLVIGCFCIGTNQVNLEYAASRGIAVFNSPFSNSRSVAELVIAEIIALSRQVTDRNAEMHAGSWNKVSLMNCHEIKGKTLGIIGYGHIGSQLSVLADSFGMAVIYYDVLQIMHLGTAKPTASLGDLLKQADIVSLHVPETPETKNMIGEREISQMKKGAYLINASRGTVVDIPALASALKSGHLAGAAVDVFPVEPFTNGKNFSSELVGSPNTILTPHIGGSTEEAQSAIGVEVGSALLKFLKTGSTLGAVNFPEVDLRTSSSKKKLVRILNCHQNVPGVLKRSKSVILKELSDT